MHTSSFVLIQTLKTGTELIKLHNLTNWTNTASQCFRDVFTISRIKNKALVIFEVSTDSVFNISLLGIWSITCCSTNSRGRFFCGRINSGVEEVGGQEACRRVACLVPPSPSWLQSWKGPWVVGVVAGHTSCRLCLGVVEVEEEGRRGVTAAGHQGEAAPWMGYPWVVGAALRRLQAAGAVAMEAGCRWQRWR